MSLSMTMQITTENGEAGVVCVLNIVFKCKQCIICSFYIYVYMTPWPHTVTYYSIKLYINYNNQ